MPRSQLEAPVDQRLPRPPKALATCVLDSMLGQVLAAGGGKILGVIKGELRETETKQMTASSETGHRAVSAAISTVRPADVEDVAEFASSYLLWASMRRLPGLSRISRALLGRRSRRAFPRVADPR